MIEKMLVLLMLCSLSWSCASELPIDDPSEGRWEQIVKTDQDNALIIANGFDWDDHERTKLLDQFTADLISIGFPRCPGNIMVSNPDWSLTVSGWKQVMKSWTQDMSEETQMKMAISLD